METRAPIFREIHKNTWLKRLTHDGRKLSVGHKKNEKYWVVFCVHDDCEALLEGYTEPRHAPSHIPEWTVSLQNTMHISHALVGTEQDFEFVITSMSDVYRFTAPSWDCMKEWVETLRSKLREMKIISPKENVYSKLPETKLPLLPTRDPTSPLPPPPPTIPDIVPGIEVLQPTVNNISNTNASSNSILNNAELSSTLRTTQEDPTPSTSSIATTVSTPHEINSIISDSLSDSSESNDLNTFILSSPPLSNTTSRSIMNLLSNPIQAYSAQNSLKNAKIVYTSSEDIENQPSTSKMILVNTPKPSSTKENGSTSTPPTNQLLAKIFADNINSKSPDIGTRFDFSTNLDSSYSKFAKKLSSSSSTDSQDEIASNIVDMESNCSSTVSVTSPFSPKLLKIPRPQTNKSEKKSTIQKQSSNENIPVSPTINEEAVGSTNITIIQLSNTKTIVDANLSKLESKNSNYKEENSDTFNVHIIPSNNTSTNICENHSNLVTVVATDNKSTKVQVHNASDPYSGYGRLVSTNSETNETSHKIKLIPSQSTNPFTIPMKSSSFNSITNISVGDEKTTNSNSGQEYEAVFFSNPSTSNNNLQKNHIADNKIVENLSQGILRHHSLGHSDTKIVEKQNGSNKGNIEILNKSMPSTSNSNPTIASTKAFESTKMKVKQEIPQKMRLTRGLTELNLNRSRLDKSRAQNSSNSKTVHNTVTQASEMKAAIEKFRRESQEQRRRSSSASEAHTNRENRHNSPSSRHVRTQKENPPPANRLTLREQQVMQLRTEMMHPGGVRLQLRRKECIGSIAWIDAFGSVWIAGWKQKEHPMLYNALHIGDQLISIGSITINSAADANKIIRSSQSLYIELIIRRIPFGRVYAIRRDIEGQCLGFIRDGNTATIVDVVPNSLAARHGLPPKANSCDGLSLTFWVLTEINGRPLNLFFKDNEVRDRLNAVGRDISILVQPSDLVTKFKKQLKSLRNHKDFIVQ